MGGTTEEAGHDLRVGEIVVVDTFSSFVYIGGFVAVTEEFVVLADDLLAVGGIDERQLRELGDLLAEGAGFGMGVHDSQVERSAGSTSELHDVHRA